MIYFVFTTYWGWSVLKDTPFLPWYLGGMANGAFTNIKLTTVFNTVDPRIYDYSLYTLGNHVNDLI